MIKNKTYEEVIFLFHSTEVGGVWNIDQIDEKVEELRNHGLNKVLNALFCQIKFHKEVLHSKGPKELFQKSANRKNYTESELIQNLKQILELNQSEDSGHETRANTLALKEINEIREEITTFKQSVATKIQVQREKRIIEQQKEICCQNSNLILNYLLVKQLNTNVLTTIFNSGTQQQ